MNERNTTDLKKYAIIFSALAVTLFHFIPLFTNKDFYPVQRYDMFSKGRALPEYRSHIIFITDRDKIEKPLSLLERNGFLFYPYNHRSLYNAIRQIAQRSGYKSALEGLLQVARLRDDHVFGLKLYEIKCSCFDFAASKLTVDGYIEKNCEKKFVEAVNANTN